MNRLSVETRNKIIDKFKKELEESSEKEIVSSTIEEGIENHWQGELKYLKMIQNYKSVEKPDITIGIKCNEYGQLVLYNDVHLLWDNIKKSKFFETILEEIPKLIKIEKEKIDVTKKNEEEIERGINLTKEKLNVNVTKMKFSDQMSFDKNEQVQVRFSIPRNDDMVGIDGIT